MQFQGGLKIDALTDEIIVGHSTIHAPAADGRTVCGIESGRRKAIQHAPLGAKPCGACFSERVVEKVEDGGIPRSGDK